jgi:[acyl-carrier-protein] S-malonyltransferase
VSTCFLFPGQGAQYPGMAKDLWETSAKVKELFTLASDSTGMDCERLLFEGSEEELKATDKTQVAMTLASVAASLVLKERGVTPAGCAGFSLGEYSALYEAGVIRLEDLFPIVKARGELMEKASRSLDAAAGGSGQAGMAAVLGMEYSAALEVLEAQASEEVYLANHSSPKQIVLAGTGSGLAAMEERFKAAGARRYVILKVSAPFHSPLLKEAAAGLEEFLASINFSDPRKAVYSNVTGKRYTSGQEAKENCVRQVVSMVRWVDEEESLVADGYTRFLEVGPGSVLSGLWKAFNRELPCLAAGKLEDIEKLEG